MTDYILAALAVTGVFSLGVRFGRHVYVGHLERQAGRWLADAVLHVQGAVSVRGNTVERDAVRRAFVALRARLDETKDQPW